MRDNTPQGVIPRSPEAWEGHNLGNIDPNGASEESIGIYAKSRCQWSGCSTDLEPALRSYGRLKPQAKVPRRSGSLPKQKYVLEEQQRGVAKNSREYYRGGCSPFPLLSVPV